MKVRFFLPICLIGTLLAAPLAADDFAAVDLEFFEKQVRPLLVEKCQQCHGAKMQKGGLRLDSRDALLKGGETGAAVKPGQPDESLLVEAINYEPDGYQMPPTGKLAAAEIAVLTEWVRRNAPWPKSETNTSATSTGFNLTERAKHWSFQPISSPAIPAISHPEHAFNPIDRFLIARLAEIDLTPGPLAEKSIQLRRLSYELTGLPPTIAELDVFQSDDSPDAFERQTDRLLASPHHGERWARHWLDLVRFAETYGHEFDFEIRYPWHYRDYLIRAFNADVPYDQIVREHVAGDLLPSPRRDPLTGTVESVIATAFWWYGQGKHSPVDIRAEECDTVDNQLDVFGKTFLGLTIACARCHDHKFDPITQKDYYALAGYLQSSRQTYADMNPPETTRQLADSLEENDRRHQQATLLGTLDRLQKFADRLADLLASRGDFPADAQTEFHKRIKAEAANDRRHPLHLWVHWSADPGKLAEQKAALEAELRRTADAAVPASVNQLVLSSPSDAAADEARRWFAEGFAFDLRPRTKLAWLTQANADRPVRGAVAPQTWAHSGLTSPRLQGTLRSPTFIIDQPYLDVLAYRRGGSPNPLRGDYKAGHIHIVVDGFQIIRDPLYGMLTVNVAPGESPVWYRRDVRRFLGSKAYLEIEDFDDGEVVIERLSLGDQGLPPAPYNELIAHSLTAAAVQSPDDVARAYQQAFQAALKALRNEEMYGVAAFKPEQLSAAADVVNWLLREEALLNLPSANAEAPQPLAEFAARRRELEAAVPAPQRTLAIAAGTAENEHLLIRGHHKKPGDEVPRRFLEVFDERQSSETNRLDLAKRLVDGENPLAPRVIVNRLWQHHFGRGLVSSSDDFGRMGQPPTHPELLDWLAKELLRGEWSLKRMQRLLVTSRAFRMSSRAEDAVAAQRDPDNRLLYRANFQRLEAEAIRDSLLLASGRLDDRLYGRSVAPHLTEFMEGRGRPGASGSLDGDGRRSLYINVRRNFLTPLFLAFDFPTPFTTMGRRSTSNVPAQALTLMNNPLIVQQAEMWVRQAGPNEPPAERIRRLYLSAFSRPVTEEELLAAEEFLQSQAAEYGSAQDPRIWTDLAHVLLNVKEFVFVE